MKRKQDDDKDDAKLSKRIKSINYLETGTLFDEFKDLFTTELNDKIDILKTFSNEKLYTMLDVILRQFLENKNLSIKTRLASIAKISFVLSTRHSPDEVLPEVSINFRARLDTLSELYEEQLLNLGKAAEVYFDLIRRMPETNHYSTKQALLKLMFKLRRNALVCIIVKEEREKLIAKKIPNPDETSLLLICHNRLHKQVVNTRHENAVFVDAEDGDFESIYDLGLTLYKFETILSIHCPYTLPSELSYWKRLYELLTDTGSVILTHYTAPHHSQIILKAAKDSGFKLSEVVNKFWVFKKY